MISHQICSPLRQFFKFLNAQKSIEIQPMTKEINSILIVYFGRISEEWVKRMKCHNNYLKYTLWWDIWNLVFLTRYSALVKLLDPPMYTFLSVNDVLLHPVTNIPHILENTKNDKTCSSRHQFLTRHYLCCFRFFRYYFPESIIIRF
jgi:hypothetical protein